MTGFVYAIGDDGGRVKIGWSTNPLRRLTKLRSDCSRKVKLLGVIPATRQQEAQAHELFAAWRENREWYRLEGAVLAFVNMLPPPAPRLVHTRRRYHPIATSGCALLAKFIEENSTQRQFAREVGCSESHLSLILSGKSGMSFGMAKRISEATGGKVPVEALPHEAAP